MIPPTPKSVGLPYPSWYDGQEQALQWIEQEREERQVLFLDAPTATGKSGIAFTIPTMTAEAAYIATWSKKLQDQYGQLGVPSIKGRGNFRCEAGAKEGLETCEFKFCDDDNPKLEEPGILAPNCPFVQQFNEGMYSNLTALNYSVLFYYLSHPKRPLHRRPWLICDEAHVIEDALGLYLDVYLDRVWLEDIEFPVELPASGRDLVALSRWAMVAQEKAILDGAHDRKQTVQWAKALDLAKRTAEALTSGYVVDDNGITVSLRVLWPLRHAKSEILGRFQHILFMSATLGDVEALAQSMMLPQETWSSLSVPSAIPVDRRLIYYYPVANLHHHATELDYTTMADAIIGWGRENFPRDRGIVHVSSYNHARKLGKLIASRGLGKRVIIQDRPDPKVQERWEKTPEAILVSCIAGLGLDLPYLFPWQVIAKLPYPGLNDKIVRMRLSQDDRWYHRQAAVKTVQIAGRVTRTPQDEGITIIADSSFDHNIWKKARASFPEWFVEALRWPTS